MPSESDFTKPVRVQIKTALSVLSVCILNGFLTTCLMYSLSPAQIKTALSELEKGNSFAFASGKAARQEERALAAQFKSNMKLAAAGVVQTGAAAVKVRFAAMFWLSFLAFTEAFVLSYGWLPGFVLLLLWPFCGSCAGWRSCVYWLFGEGFTGHAVVGVAGG